jgi:hypothetical protein
MSEVLFLQWMVVRCSAFIMSQIRSMGLKSGELRRKIERLEEMPVETLALVP